MRYIVTAQSGLNIRTGPGTNYDKTDGYSYGAVVAVGAVQDGWGQTDRGWVSMDYLRPVEAADEVAVFVQPGYAVDGVEHLAHGEHAPGHREAEQLDLGDGLGAVRLALFAERAALHAAHAAGEVDRRGQRSGRVLVVVDVRKEFARVQVAAEAAGGSHDGHAALHELLAHEVDEDGALADDVFVHRLLQADGDGLHLADAHAAVGEEALEHGHQLAHLVKERLVAHGYAAAAGEAELARGEWLFQSC